MSPLLAGASRYHSQWDHPLTCSLHNGIHRCRRVRCVTDTKPQFHSIGSTCPSIVKTVIISLLCSTQFPPATNSNNKCMFDFLNAYVSLARSWSRICSFNVTQLQYTVRWHSRRKMQCNVHMSCVTERKQRAKCTNVTFFCTTAIHSAQVELVHA